MCWIRAFILVVKSGVALPLIDVEGNIRPQERSVAFGFEQEPSSSLGNRDTPPINFDNALSSGILSGDSDREGSLSRPCRQYYYNVHVPVLGFGEKDEWISSSCFGDSMSQDADISLSRELSTINEVSESLE